MRLSIVTINYNNAEGLKRTLDSVASQTYRDIEHIIVDGGSTDDSVNIIRDYISAVKQHEDITKGQDSVVDIQEWIDECTQIEESGKQSPFFDRKIIWTSEPDNGIYHAMNKGLRKATGSYVQILNSGDILAAPDATEKMMCAIESCEYPSILYGNMIRDYGNGKLALDTCRGELRDKREEIRAERVEWTMDDFIKGTVNHDPTYIRRDLYEKYGLYDENLKICSDWKWFVNAVVFGGEKLYYVPIDVTIFDTTGISETNLAFREQERHAELEKMLPAAILKDYDTWHFPIAQVKRLKKHHLWGLVYFIERVLFKFEKWHIIK